MINLILISLLLHYIGLYIFKPKIDSLYCGIGGYIGNNFNKYKFNILGLYNDSRGGDSCGVIANNNGNIELNYGHDKTKLYKDFVEFGGLKDVNLEAPNFALLHCRKASVGGISLSTAQPVVLTDENNNIVFSMIHNGTLINYKELADKYDVNYALNESDSQIFCKIIYKVGYKVLSEYDGAGAFVFWDKRDGSDTVKIFKGASLFYENDNNIYIERSLYCIQEKDSFWFSSMEESLNFINDTNSIVKNVPDNILFTIKNGNIIAEDKIDRSARKQVDRLQINWERKRQEDAKKTQYTLPKHQNYDNYDYYDDNNYRDYNNKNTSAGGSIDHIVVPFKNKNKIYFNIDGLYYINETPCNGAIEATPAGFTDISSVQKKMYYFVDGVLMKSYFDYLCAIQFVSQMFQLQEDDCVEMYLAAYSPHSVPLIMDDNVNSLFVEFYEYNPILKDTQLSNGTFEPFFNYTKNRYILKNGDIIWRYEYNETTPTYKMTNEQAHLDEQILSGKLSKNSIKKMIRKNLKEVYARN